jgi:CubicO group peptidase (beta-lactamase class C family)
LDGDTYQQEFENLVAQGYRLLKLSGYSVNGQDFYASIWDQSPGPAWVGMHRVPGSDYQAQFDQLTSQGYRPVDISGYEMNGGDAYAAIFEQSQVNGWSAHHGVPGADYQALFEQNAANGLRPVRVSGYTVGGSDYFASIWIGADGQGWSAIHGADNAGYQQAFNDATANGMRLADVSGYEWNGSDYYAAVFDYNTSSYWVAHHNLSADAYQRAFDENSSSGYTLTHVAGYGVAGEARYAAIWSTNWEPTGGTVGKEAVDKIANDAITAAGVPGMSVAIAQNGRLVYAKAYGTADKATGEAMTVKSRLRIASVSKPITAVAIFQLEEAGVLSRADLVFGDDGWLGNDYGTMAYSTNLTSITIDHLLTHTSGGWGGKKSDTMFQRTDLDHDGLITWTIDTYPPTDTPGTVMAYSNFGYCLLGRIIERATGMSYEAYVASTTLAQCGISDMQIAGDSLAERAANEVVYDGTNSTIGDPYGIPVHRMDSHGGWIATATDLLRFLVYTDGLASPGDIIGATSVATMTTGSAANSGYGRGWGIIAMNSDWNHNGKLGGTESVIARRSDGICYAVIANGNGIDPFKVGEDMAYAIADWGPGTAL